MALTLAPVTGVSPEVFGGLRVKIVDITFDSSYPTGGEALTPADLGLTEEIHFLLHEGSGYVLQYDRTNDKLLAYWGDNNNASDGPLIEVADTTNLSSVTVRCIAFGI